MEKTQNHQHQDQKVKNPSKNRKKTPKTPKGPSSVEDIKAKMQASIEKGGLSSQGGSQVHQLCQELLPDDGPGGYSRSLAVEEVSLRKNS
jgi:hypothetical protein